MKKADKEKITRMTELAEKYGVDKNYLFTTTLDRYKMQLNLLAMLEAELRKDGVIVKKQYVKSRENIYCHPAVSKYNSIADSANKTAGTLLNIISKMKNEKEKTNRLSEFMAANQEGIDDELS